MANGTRRFHLRRHQWSATLSDLVDLASRSYADPDFRRRVSLFTGGEQRRKREMSVSRFPVFWIMILLNGKGDWLGQQQGSGGTQTGFHGQPHCLR